MKEKALPEGWVETKLSDALEIVLGQSPESQFVNNEGKGLPFYQGKAEFGDLYPTPRNYCEKPKKIAKPNDILLSVRAPVGPTNLATENVAIGRGLAAIRAINDDYKYVLYYFRYLEPWLKMQGQGSTFEAITGKFVKDLTFIRPPLETQQKLAKKFTALLSQVAEIKQRLEKIPALLKTYRARAVNGELSAKWREENGVSLESWAISTLKNLTTKIGSGSTPKGAEYLPEGVPFIRSLNIYTHFIKFDDLAFINDEQAQKLKNVVIEQGDLLLNITGASIGRVNIAPKEFIGGRVNQHVAIIRSKLDKIRPHFLHIFFASPKIQKWINDENYGSTRQALTKGMLEELKIAVPSLEEQNYITQAVEKHLNFANQLEAQVNAALERVNLMTQAILAKGFRGELL